MACDSNHPHNKPTFLYKIPTAFLFLLSHSSFLATKVIKRVFNGLSCMIRKHAINARWVANPRQVHSHFPHSFWSSVSILFIVKSEDSLSYLQFMKVSPSMLIISSRMFSKFGACALIFLEHVSFWCPFLNSHSTMHYSNIGVHLRSNIE